MMQQNFIDLLRRQDHFDILGQGSQCSATLEFGFRGGVGSLEQARLAGTGM